MAEFTEAIATGDYVSKLVALRDLLSDRLDRASSRDVAAISKQLNDVLRELSELTVPEEADSVDEVATRRASRRAAAQMADPAAVRK